MIRTIRKFLLFLTSLCQRLLCFLNIKRTRHNSGDSYLPVYQKQTEKPANFSTNPNFANSEALYAPIHNNSSLMEEMEDNQFTDWDDWSTQKQSSNNASRNSAHNQQSSSVSDSRKSRIQASSKQTSEDNPALLEYFKELEPTVKKTKKHFIGNESPTPQASKFAVKEDVQLGNSSELGTWNENEGWDVDEASFNRVPNIAGAIRLS